MDEKETKFVEVAIGVFTRYGVRKTTMGDIAEHAGVSRQTLYATYANKDEILTAAIGHAYDMTMKAIKNDWRDEPTIGGKLDVFFKHGVTKYYVMLKAMPDSDDLITGFNAVGASQMRCKLAEKKQMLVEQLQPFAPKLQSHNMQADDLADMIVASSANFKSAAEDAEHLERLLSSLKSSVLALLGEPSNS